MKKNCPHCENEDYDHVGWNHKGKPVFKCRKCTNTWHSGLTGKNFYDYSLTHPEKIVILDWGPEDYKKYKLKVYCNMVIIKPK